MLPHDLNLTSTITGYQSFLFIHFPYSEVDIGLTDSLDRLGENMENIHYVSGNPSE